MPIIDPSLQCFFVKNPIIQKNKKSGLDFFVHYLKIASLNINKSLATVETAELFKSDLKKSIIFLNDELKCKFQIDQDFNEIQDLYKHLHDRIIKKYKKSLESFKGKFFICNDQFQTKFFRPSVLYSKQHSWLLSDTPIAILTIYDLPLTDKFMEYIKLEIDLMEASGFTLVLCASATSETVNFYLQLIKDNQFAEIHFNIFNIDYLQKFYKTIYEKYHSHFEHYKGYFYLYHRYFDYDKNQVDIFEISDFDGQKKELRQNTYDNIINYIKTRPRINIFCFNKKIEKTFKKVELFQSKPFAFCKEGFKSSHLRIRLSNVPLFDYSDPYSSFITTQVSGLCLAYISPSDFLNWKRKRIKILFDDTENNHHHYKKYVNFDDLHKIRIDLYVNRVIFLKKIDKNQMKEVERVKNRIKYKDEKNSEFKKEFFMTLIKDQKIKKGIRYVGYAYTKFIKGEIKNFNLHEEQILAAIEACKTFFSQHLKSEKSKSEISKVNEKEKGVIYQVKTGEGKSCIVCLIAAVLALMGKTVHITSSNINLANRDYYKSYKFFKSLGIKTAILLHYNELPYSPNNDFKSQSLLYNNSNLEESFYDSNNNSENFQLNETKQNHESNESNEFFKFFSSDYLSDAIKSEKSAFQNDYYPKEFFDKRLFKNQLRMNFPVCGIDNNNRLSNKNKADVIFSTFVNFECLYLRMVETCRGFVNEYFNNCGLLIDEADSILIDEIANGTIVSREMKSNAKPILKYVYQQQRLNVPPEETLENIKEIWTNVGSLDIHDIEQMYEEIELVNEPEFSNGKKYYISTFQVKNSGRIKRLIKKTTNFVQKVSNKFTKAITKNVNKCKRKLFDKNKKESKEEKVDAVKTCILDGIESIAVTEESEEEEEEEDINTEEEEIADGPVAEFKHIIPFDYDHKGVLEPNKEFSGFIHQFIAIKEGLKSGNENMLIKDISMNYLYVSHPIFVNLYGKVCGFTGTVGPKKEQKLYYDIYNLKTFKIPRHTPNLLVELPIILCDTIDERDEAIATEIEAFHEQGFPVLAIFQDLTEIIKVQFLLNSKGIVYINIFDGKEQVIRPDKIAGIKGAISLGTNFCGRGADIKVQSKPLHVIITFYTPNERVLRQAYGRTARQDKKGSYRIICLKDQFFDAVDMLDSQKMSKAIDDFQVKNHQQEKFIKHFKRRRPWIFSGDIKKQELTRDDIKILRESQINVNRIVAFNYKFPICMTPETFLHIQAQKIFSLFNCPNSKYTWILFQRYLREMILESWSLMLNKFDQENSSIRGTKKYRILLRKKRKELYNQIEKYTPMPNKKGFTGIIPTFMNIHKIVLDKYQENILKIYKDITTYKQLNSSGFFSLQFGFRPYSLYSNSGSRIGIGNIGEMNYIIDPELRYERKLPDNKFTILSITEKIDDIFNKICQIISQKIGEKIGLKFFLRRTLGGCEFGLCFDAIMEIIDPENEILKDPYCIVDKDPLLLFTIFVKNTVPILAGILIIVLVFVAVLAKKIAAWIVAFPAQFTAYFSKKILEKGLKLILNYVSEKLWTKILEKLLDYLTEIVDKQIKEIKNNDKKVGEVLENLFHIFQISAFETIGEEAFKPFGKKVKIKSKFGKFLKGVTNHGILFKISLLLILCIGTFIMNFNCHKLSLRNESKDAKVYDSHINNKNIDKNKMINELQEKNQANVKLNDIDNSDTNKLNHGLCEFQFKESEMKSFLFQMDLVDASEFLTKRQDFNLFKFPLPMKSKIGHAEIIYLTKIDKSKDSQIYFQIRRYGAKRPFKQEVVLYSALKCPFIVPFVGYSVERKNNYIYLELPSEGFLDDHIKRKDKNSIWTPAAKVVIAYGIAYIMNYLHDCHVIHRDLKPSNICLDSLLYPYLYNFYSAKHIDKLGYSIIPKECPTRYKAPEFFENSKSCQGSFKTDVYSYGMLLYNLITEIEPFEDFNNIYNLINAIINNERPKFPESTPQKWKDLISKCWDQDPNNRPTFAEILKEIDSPEFLKTHLNASNILSRYKAELLRKINQQKMMKRLNNHLFK